MSDDPKDPLTPEERAQCERAAADLVSGTAHIEGEPVDELGARRTSNSDDELAVEGGRAAAAAASAMLSSISQQQRVKDFGEWMLAKMPHHEFSHQAHSMAGSIIGGILGSWFECGASPELMKEYLSRFVDMTHAQYEGARRALDEYQAAMYVCDGCGFPNPRDSPKCAKCEKDNPHA